MESFKKKEKRCLKKVRIKKTIGRKTIERKVRPSRKKIRSNKNIRHQAELAGLD